MKNQLDSIPKQRAVMRISMKEGDFSVQKQAISKLTNEEKEKLKALLENILRELWVFADFIVYLTQDYFFVSDKVEAISVGYLLVYEHSAHPIWNAVSIKSIKNL